MISISYFVRTARLEYIRKIGAESVVIFMHGILSDTRAAFGLDSPAASPWTSLLKTPGFANYDVALFCYGRTDLSFVFQLDSPFNNLRRLANELHGHVKRYRSVIFIAHSQGGLLAKTYASLYYLEQGILITTLHTPHGNRAFSVMRTTIDKLWNDRARYVVPHLFCGSVNDNRIVKPDNAITGGVDDEYMSSDHSKAALGHSHLSTSPDRDLLALINKKTFYFASSGLSQKIYELSQFSRRHDGHFRPVQIRLSRSKKRLDEYSFGERVKTTIEKPWKHDFATCTGALNGVSPVSIHVHGCSVNYFVRCLFSDTERELDDLNFTNLDENQNSHVVANDTLCENVFSSGKSVPNPYRELPFDIVDFDKKDLISDKEFLEIFSRILINGNFTLKTYAKLPRNVYEPKLREFYRLAVSQYRILVVRNIFNNLPTRLEIGVVRFEQMLVDIITEIRALPSYKCEHSDIYTIINCVGLASRCKFGILGVEYIISKLMRSDGDLYWLDRNIAQIL